MSRDDLFNLFSSGKNISEIDDPKLVESGKMVSRLLEEALATLITDFGDKISEMTTCMWKIVGSKYVTVGMISFVESVSFFYSKKDGVVVSAVAIPTNWIAKFNEDPIHGTGALVFASSQAVDSYNDRFGIDSNEKIKNRARAFEAQYLHEIRKSLSGRSGVWTPNKYQKDLMEAFPEGLVSDEAEGLLYEYKDVMRKSGLNA